MIEHGGELSLARQYALLGVSRSSQCLGEVADTFLAPLPRGGRYEPMDGRAFLLSEDEVYDVIVLDAFADRTTTPAHLHTREFFGLVRSHVAEDGGTL